MHYYMADESTGIEEIIIHSEYPAYTTKLENYYAIDFIHAPHLFDKNGELILGPREWRGHKWGVFKNKNDAITFLGG